MMRMKASKSIMSKSTWLLIFFLAIRTGAIYAQQRPGIRAFVTPPEDCYVTDPIEPENIYFFLRVQILALSLAQRGEQANFKVIATGKMVPLSEIDKTIMGLRQERVQNVCASFVVSYYSDSKIPAMAAVAKSLAKDYDQLVDMSNQILGINLQMAVQKWSGPSPQRQFSELLRKRQEIFQKMTDALDTSLGLLVDEDRKNAAGQPDHLILSHAEVKELMEYLNDRFPELKNSQTVPSGDFAKQAALIRSFLNRGYKTTEFP
jgi:hypothetical protein